MILILYVENSYVFHLRLLHIYLICNLKAVVKVCDMRSLKSNTGARSNNITKEKKGRAAYEEFHHSL